MYTQASAPQRLYKTSTTQQAPLGSVLIDNAGRIWRYALAGAAAIPGGTVCQGPAAVATTWGRTDGGNVGQFSEGATIGAKGVNLSTAAITENDYAEGLFAHAPAGTGFCLPISSNPGFSGTTNHNILLAEGVPIAWTTGSLRAGISRSIYKGVVVAAAPPTRALAGAAQRDVAAGDYFWILQHGQGIAIRDGTLAEGQPVMCSDGTAGAVEAWNFTVDTTAGGVVVATPTNMPIGRVVEYTSTFTVAAMIHFNIC